MWLLIMEKYTSEIRKIYIFGTFSVGQNHIGAILRLLVCRLHLPNFIIHLKKVNLVKRAIAINSPHVDVDDCGIFCKHFKRIRDQSMWGIC